MAFDLQQFQGVKEAVGLRGALVQANQYAHGVYEAQGEGKTLTGHDDWKLAEIRKKYGITEEAPARRFHIRVQEKGLVKEGMLIKHQLRGGYEYAYITEIRQDWASYVVIKPETADKMLSDMPVLKAMLIDKNFRSNSWIGSIGDAWVRLVNRIPLISSDSANDSYGLLALGVLIALGVIGFVILSQA